jgi:hypothetical protein
MSSVKASIDEIKKDLFDYIFILWPANQKDIWFY